MEPSASISAILFMAGSLSEVFYISNIRAHVGNRQDVHMDGYHPVHSVGGRVEDGHAFVEIDGVIDIEELGVIPTIGGGDRYK